MRYLLYIIVLTIGLDLFSQEEKKYIREGNKYYEKEQFEKASSSYKKALGKNKASVKAEFNLGDALYKEKKYADAIQHFQKFAATTDDKNLKASAYHNIGNSYLASGKLEESIDAYKQSLRENPKDDQTRYNLSYALKKLKEQQNQENKDDQNKDNQDQDQENKDKNEDKDNKDQENKENQNKDQENKNEEKKNDENKNEGGDEKKDENKENQQSKPNQLSKADAQRMLDALNNEEKKVQAKLKKKKVKGQKVKIEKDW